MQTGSPGGRSVSETLNGGNGLKNSQVVIQHHQLHVSQYSSWTFWGQTSLSWMCQRYDVLGRVCVCRTLSIRAPAPTWSTPTCWGRLQRCPRPTTTSWFTGSKSKCVCVFAADVAQVSSLFSLLTCYSRPTYPSAEPADFCFVAVSYFTLFPITESEEQAMVCWTDYKALRGKFVIWNRVNNSEYV